MQNINTIKEAVLACIDGSKYSEAVCEYGLYIAKELKLPLVLLNTIEHTHISSKSDLSGSIGFGERDTLLNDLSDEDAVESKKLINNGKDILKSLKEKVINSGFEDVVISQRHGTLYENLKELEEKMRVVLFGISGVDHNSDIMEIGSQVENIIRDVNVPIILVNKEYSPIKNVMIAFNGESGSTRALEEVSSSPMLGRDIKRFVINICNDTKKSQELIENAKEIIQDKTLNCEFISKSGDPLEEILNSQKSNNIDIMAIGSYSHGKLKTALFGSFTTKLIQNVKIPLIILK
ncbi:universal stress protein [Sulfurimonas sp. CVO]|mgnify:CR=1 FL=1|jgi:nucleotide-binding universal stress UspA family protein|uniref:universal stress protein n=1 Tax=Sulfurimonas sp. CVO TaxID=2283483 RepID=UPI000CBAFE26|nr:universal stress protein [Sulfurimonas sp. CVO]PLY13987.1 MAG: universal stress protein [Sulfurimonas sp.]QHG91197.1 universal stress protein [Sulfurimonas sp. CVO]